MPQALPMIAMTGAQAIGKGASAATRQQGIPSPGAGLLSPAMLQMLMNKMPGMAGSPQGMQMQQLGGMAPGIASNPIQSFGSGLLNF